MSEDYVQKDTFTETIRRLEALNEASEARTQAQISEIRGLTIAIGERAARFEDVVYTLSRSLDKRVDDLTKKPGLWERMLTSGMGLVGFAIGLAAVIVAGVQVYLAVK